MFDDKMCSFIDCVYKTDQQWDSTSLESLIVTKAYSVSD